MAETEKSYEGVQFYVPRRFIDIIDKKDGSQFAKIVIPAGTQVGGLDLSYWKMTCNATQVKPGTGRVWLPETNRKGKPWEVELTRDFGHMEGEGGDARWQSDVRVERVGSKELADGVRSAMQARKESFNYVRIPASRWVDGEQVDALRRLDKASRDGRELVSLCLPERFYIDYADGGGIDASGYEFVVPEDSIIAFEHAYSVEIPKASSKDSAPYTVDLTRFSKDVDDAGRAAFRKSEIVVTSNELAAAAERCMAERREHAQRKTRAHDEARSAAAAREAGAYRESPMAPDPDLVVVQDARPQATIASDLEAATRAAKAKEAPANPTRAAEQAL